MNNFDFIAPFYSLLARLVFGNTILESQKYHLSVIKKDDKVAVIGGGSGEILNYIGEHERIDFVEKSAVMEAKAKRYGKPSISFHRADFLDWDSGSKYDVIVCPFFLDCFSETTLKSVMQKIRGLICEEGMLIVVDFSEQTNPILLKVMHLFFRITADLEARSFTLPKSNLEQEGFVLVEQQQFKYGIESSVYRRS